MKATKNSHMLKRKSVSCCSVGKQSKHAPQIVATHSLPKDFEAQWQHTQEGEETTLQLMMILLLPMMFSTFLTTLFDRVLHLKTCQHNVYVLVNNQADTHCESNCRH